MKRAFVLTVLILVVPVCGSAESSDAAPSASTEQAAPAGDDEVEVVSTNGSITRAKCPHTCVKRGIPRKHCREWKSRMYGDRCYVQDLRLPSDAVPLGGPGPAAGSNTGTSSHDAVPPKQ